MTETVVKRAQRGGRKFRVKTIIEEVRPDGLNFALLAGTEVVARTKTLSMAQELGRKYFQMKFNKKTEENQNEM